MTKTIQEGVREDRIDKLLRKNLDDDPETNYSPLIWEIADLIEREVREAKIKELHIVGAKAAEIAIASRFESINPFELQLFIGDRLALLEIKTDKESV